MLQRFRTADARKSVPASRESWRNRVRGQTDVGAVLDRVEDREHRDRGAAVCARSLRLRVEPGHRAGVDALGRRPDDQVLDDSELIGDVAAPIGRDVRLRSDRRCREGDPDDGARQRRSAPCASSAGRAPAERRRSSGAARCPSTRRGESGRGWRGRAPAAAVWRTSGWSTICGTTRPTTSASTPRPGMSRRSSRRPTQSSAASA